MKKNRLILPTILAFATVATLVARQQNDTTDIQNQLSSVIAKLEKINQDSGTPQTLQAEVFSIRALRALQDHR